MRLLLAFALVVRARHVSMFKCLPLQGRNLDKLRSLFARRAVDLNCLVRVRTCRDDISTRTFESAGDSGKALRLVQYIISDRLVHEEFNWKRLFLKRLALRGELGFKVAFFREMRRGYIAYFREGEHLYWQDALSRMGAAEFRQYQLNLVALFRAYEEAGAVFAGDSLANFAMDARQPARPVVASFDDVRRLGGEFYAPRQDALVAQQFGELLGRADRSAQQREFYRARATSAWHAFALLSVVCELFRQYAFVQEQEPEMHARRGEFGAVAERLWTYDLRVLQNKSLRPSIAEIESILTALPAP